MAQDDRACVLDLILVELSEVLEIHLRLLRVYYCCESVKLDIVVVEILHRDDDVAEFSYSGWLDQNPVWIKFLNNFVQCLAEITHKRAADTACVHLIYLYSGLFQEPAVNSDLSKLILDQNDLLVAIRFRYQLLDESRLASSQESRKNIYLCHL